MFPITIPPLRERRDDIPLLARHFIERFCREMKKQPLMLSPSRRARAAAATAWPGNVRELQNCIERAVILADDDVIHPRHLHLRRTRSSFRRPAIDPWGRIDLTGSLAEASRRVLDEVERLKIARALAETSGDRGRAAELLGIGYKTLAARIKLHRSIDRAEP